MKKIITIAAAALSVGLFAAPASAGTISFADFAAGNEGGVDNNSIINFSGTNIQLISGWDLGTGPGGWTIFTNSSGGTGPFSAYFDDLSSGKPAGLGVCRVLDGAGGTTGPGAECLDSSDDSIDGEAGLNEVIALIFEDGPFDLRALSFRDGNHNDINDSMGLVEYGINGLPGGGVGGITTFADLVARAIAGEFIGATSIALAYVNTEFYLESISDVPIPGAIPLLLSGIAGLGFASRKKKAA